MDNGRQIGVARLSRGGKGVVLAAFLAGLGLLSVPAQALTIIVDIGWGYTANYDMDNAALASGYYLQEGSIVQIIAYDSVAYPNTDFLSNDADDNFDYMGTTPSGDVYNPYTAPDGHLIAYTTTIGTPIGGNQNGYDWYNIYASFQVLDNYDSLYIRVFGVTDFPHATVVESHWGISGVETDGGAIGTWYVVFDDVDAPNVAYFEVIPEPGSLGLLALGGTGLWVARLRRRKRG